MNEQGRYLHEYDEFGFLVFGPNSFELGAQNAVPVSVQKLFVALRQGSTIGEFARIHQIKIGALQAALEHACTEFMHAHRKNEDSLK